MRFAPSVLAVAAAIAATPLAHAGDPVQLNKEETQKALSGKSLFYELRGGSLAGGQLVIFFSSDGRMTMKASSSSRGSSGTWSVDDDGKYCLKVISGTGSDGCRHLLKTDTGYALKTERGTIIPVDKLE